MCRMHWLDLFHPVPQAAAKKSKKGLWLTYVEPVKVEAAPEVETKPKKGASHMLTRKDSRLQSKRRSS